MNKSIEMTDLIKKVELSYSVLNGLVSSNSRVKQLQGYSRSLVLQSSSDSNQDAAAKAIIDQELNRIESTRALIKASIVKGSSLDSPIKASLIRKLGQLPPNVPNNESPYSRTIDKDTIDHLDPHELEHREPRELDPMDYSSPKEQPMWLKSGRQVTGRVKMPKIGKT